MRVPKGLLHRRSGQEQRASGVVGRNARRSIVRSRRLQQKATPDGTALTRAVSASGVALHPLGAVRDIVDSILERRQHSQRVLISSVVHHNVGLPQPLLCPIASYFSPQSAISY